jgi:hypothetical protein
MPGTVEGRRCIDVLRWNRLDTFCSSRRFSWDWIGDREVVASIEVESDRERVILKSLDEDCSDISQTVASDMEPVSIWRRETLVHMLGLFLWSLLRPESDQALQRREAICVPEVPSACLCQPARNHAL